MIYSTAVLKTLDCIYETSKIILSQVFLWRNWSFCRLGCLDLTPVFFLCCTGHCLTFFGFRTCIEKNKIITCLLVCFRHSISGSSMAAVFCFCLSLVLSRAYTIGNLYTFDEYLLLIYNFLFSLFLSLSLSHTHTQTHRHTHKNPKKNKLMHVPLDTLTHS